MAATRAGQRLVFTYVGDLTLRLEGDFQNSNSFHPEGNTPLVYCNEHDEHL